MNINKVILMGRLTSDPELRKTASDKSVTSISVAVNRADKNKSVDFINCTAFGSTAEFIQNYFKKGACIIIFGSMRIDKWIDNNGDSKEKAYILIDSVQFGESKKSSGNEVKKTDEAAEYFEDLDDVDFPFA